MQRRVHDFIILYRRFYALISYVDTFMKTKSYRADREMHRNGVMKR